MDTGEWTCRPEISIYSWPEMPVDSSQENTLLSLGLLCLLHVGEQTLQRVCVFESLYPQTPILSMMVLIKVILLIAGQITI